MIWSRKQTILATIIGLGMFALFFTPRHVISNQVALWFKRSPSQTTLQTPCPIKAVVCDIGGVLLKTSVLKTVWAVGPLDILNYSIFDWKNPLALKQKARELLTHLAKLEGSSSSTYQGTPLSKSVEAWQKGLLTNQDMLSVLHNALPSFEKHNSFSSTREKDLVLKITTMIMNPAQQAAMKEEIDHTVSLIKQVATQRPETKLIVLSNMERELVPHVKTTFAHIFNHFHDFIASGEIAMIKPQQDIFLHVLTKHNLKPEECLFIDDLAENIQAAHALGFKTVHMTKTDGHESLKTTLQTYGLIKD